QVAGGLAVRGDVSLADAGARGDPLIAGVDGLRQVGVGQHFLRQVTAGTGDAREHLLGHADVLPMSWPVAGAATHGDRAGCLRAAARRVPARRRMSGASAPDAY